MEGAVQERAQAVSGLGHGCRDTWIRDEKGQNFRGLCIRSIRACCVGSKSPGCSLRVGLVSISTYFRLIGKEAVYC